MRELAKLYHHDVSAAETIGERSETGTSALQPRKERLRSLALIVDRQGRVLAAQLPAAADSEDAAERRPAVGLVFRDDQREVSIAVPREILNLPGPDLQRFFSEIRIRPDGEPQLPKLKIHKDRGE